MGQHLGVAALTELWSLIKGNFARKVAAAPASTTVDIQLQTEGAQTLNTATIPAATTTTAGVFTAADKVKLDGKADATHTHTQDQITGLKDALAGKASTSHSHSVASSSASGFMSAADKQKLDGIAAGGTPYKLPPATASTLGGVKVGDGLSVESDGQLSVTNYYDFVTLSNFPNVLDDTTRFSVVAADATSAAVIVSAFGSEPAVKAPSVFKNAYLIFIAINVRYYLAWMNGTKLELAPLNVEVDTQTQATTLYARGRSSMAYGVAGVDESWTITALPTDVDGVSF